MNVGLIMAGGCGDRTQSKTPKQFVEINGIPVIIHTLLAFQQHPQIDEICCVCVDGWQHHLLSLTQKYNISKVKYITTGGPTAHDSIFCGLQMMQDIYPSDTLIVQHDAVRPLVTPQLISDCIATTQKYGNAIAYIPSRDVLVHTIDDTSSTIAIPRSTTKTAQTPNGYRLNHMLTLHRRAKAKNSPPSTATYNLLIESGETVHLYHGSEINLKITHNIDFAIAETLLQRTK